MCQDTSELKKNQSFEFRCAKPQVDQEKIFKVQSQVPK